MGGYFYWTQFFYERGCWIVNYILVCHRRIVVVNLAWIVIQRCGISGLLVGDLITVCLRD